jgi:hypothetical protein
MPRGTRASRGPGRRSGPTAFPRRGTPSATPAWTSPSTSQTSAARPATSPAGGRRRCAGRSMRRRSSLAARAVPTTPTTSRPRRGSAATAHASLSPASCSSAATTRCANSETRRGWPPSAGSGLPQHRGLRPDGRALQHVLVDRYAPAARTFPRLSPIACTGAEQRSPSLGGPSRRFVLLHLHHLRQRPWPDRTSRRSNRFARYATPATDMAKERRRPEQPQRQRPRPAAATLLLSRHMR